MTPPPPVVKPSTSSATNNTTHESSIAFVSSLASSTPSLSDASDVFDIGDRPVPLPQNPCFADVLDILDAMVAPPSSLSSPLPQSRSRWHGERALLISADSIYSFLLYQSLAADKPHAIQLGRLLVRCGGIIPTFRVENSSSTFDPSTSSSQQKLYVHRGLSFAREARHGTRVLNQLLAFAPPAAERREISTPRTMISILKDLSIAFANICHVVVSIDGQFVNYGDIRGSSGWRQALVLLCELAYAKEDDGEFARSEDNVKKACWFNLYNLLIFHAKLTFGHPNDLVKRGKFFNDAAYIIAGKRLSSIELEHDVLRRRMHPEDNRLAWMLREKDPRMHFVLNCGAHSCPPLMPVNHDDVEGHLQRVTSKFIEDNAEVNDKAQSVKLSRLFKWFRKDFTPYSDNDAALLGWIAARASNDKSEQLHNAIKNGYKVKFDVYNWSDNGDSNAKPDIRFMSIYDVSFSRTA